MTTEVAIINQNAIALAADSAITSGRNQKVWKTTDKLFSLSPNNDIGIMVYGSDNFQGIAWEVLIKQFCMESAAQFDTVAECRDKFISFLEDHRFANSDIDDNTVHLICLKILSLLSDVPSVAKGQIRQFRAKLLTQIGKISQRVNSEHMATLVLKRKAFIDRYVLDISSLAEEHFSQKITKKLSTQLARLCFDYAVRTDCLSDYESGVVIAGFGKSEFFPVMFEVIVDGRVFGTVRAWHNRTRNANLAEERSGFMVPFGQFDMAYLFLEGLLPAYEEFTASALSEILTKKSDELIKAYVPSSQQVVETALQKKDNKSLVEGFLEAFSNYRTYVSINPVMKIVTALPKEEMASMAEAMVEITSLRRRIDSPLESVGGPVDVAVIAKGDGFVWLRRKHYFKPELNGDLGERRKARQG